MPLSLQNMRDAILRATGTDLSDWTNGNVDLDLFINRSWWDIMDQFDFREREGNITTFTTIAGVRQYDLTAKVTSFDSIQRVVIEDLFDESHTDLILISDYDYENQFINDSDNYGKPERYFRRNKYIYLYNTPDNVYTIYVYSLVTLDDIASNGPPIPQSWHEIIELGSIWRAMLDVRDFQNARFIKENQISLIQGRTPVKAKELADTKKSGIEVLGRDY